ncbi:retrovirus-related pol polyprotein LINE-1 [Tanacetum coccineum]
MDLGNVGFIKDGDRRSIVNEVAIRRRWKEYFSVLFNGQRSDRTEDVDSIRPDEILIEAWRCLGGEGVRWLKTLFNMTFLRAKMPEEWRLSERVIERRLRREIGVLENQFGFMPGRSTIKAIHIIRSLMEKYRERQKDLHLAYLDFEKAYDTVSWARTYVRTLTGNTKYFSVDVGLHQGSAISLYLFALILDELKKGIQESIPWCLIFVDDIVLVLETQEGSKGRLEQNENKKNEEEEIYVGEHILESKESFRYLGSMIHQSERIWDDVTHRIQVGMLK